MNMRQAEFRRAAPAMHSKRKIGLNIIVKAANDQPVVGNLTYHHRRQRTIFRAQAAGYQAFVEILPIARTSSPTSAPPSATEATSSTRTAPKSARAARSSASSCGAASPRREGASSSAPRHVWCGQDEAASS